MYFIRHINFLILDISGNKNKEEEQLLLGMRPKEAESYLARKQKAENSKHMKKQDPKIDFDPSFFRFQTLFVGLLFA
jgi:hypothetical protein